MVGIAQSDFAIRRAAHCHAAKVGSFSEHAVFLGALFMMHYLGIYTDRLVLQIIENRRQDVGILGNRIARHQSL